MYECQGQRKSTQVKEEERMAQWVCTECGEKAEGRCRPKECPKCKAPKDKFVKAE